MTYYRPIVGETGHALAGGWARFDHVEVISRGQRSDVVPADAVPDDVLARLTSPRAPIMGVAMNTPAVMGILNVTPDSFSDGGDFVSVDAAFAQAQQMQADGAAIIDVGGESTRPGAQEVPVTDEIARVAPVIARIAADSDVVISLDTRKASVFDAVPTPVLLNDVTALRFDPKMANAVAQRQAPVCLMHSIATPETMQARARYDDVLLDVYDHLETQVAFACGEGILRENIIVDPGVGFGKTLEHNLALIRGLSLFHGLGCPILLGASRKRFIGTLGQAPEAKDRLGGSVAVALEGVRQGVQILRVHDTFATKQAIDLQMAIGKAGSDGT